VVVVEPMTVVAVQTVDQAVEMQMVIVVEMVMELETLLQ
jgi:hypothetical protein